MNLCCLGIGASLKFKDEEYLEEIMECDALVGSNKA